MKTTVIHHSADYDGIFCREIARKFLPDAELIGWDFADKPLLLDQIVEPSGYIYILDLPADKPLGLDFTKREDRMKIDFERLIWIDHHASSIASHPREIPGYRIDGVAACRLAWQWLTNELGPNNPHCHPCDYNLPQKEHYIEREVSEPLAIRLAGEYDIWDKRDPDADSFQYALRTEPLTPVGWAALLDDDRVFVNDLLVKGRVCQRYQQDVDASVVNHRSFLVEFEGLKFLALNTARCNSNTFTAKDFPETGHDALMGLYFNGRKWTVSLYHAKHRTDIDLSKIAVKHGGGGHKGACGFTSDVFPLTNQVCI